MSIKKIVMSNMLLVAVMTLAATPEITDVAAKQRYPWNGLVDITCKVTGIYGVTNGLWFAVAALDLDSGNACNVSHVWVVKNGMRSSDWSVCTNGNYRLLWDAQTDLGAVRYTNMVMRITFDTHKRVQLWAGGPYWSETNVGADEPWESGYFFWWGDTVGYKRENDAWVASDGSSSNFSFGWSETPTCVDIATLHSEGWVTGLNVLVPLHDAARRHWGGIWRMPTQNELAALKNNCEWTWTSMNGMNGYVVCGRGDYSTASIFLPASGRGYGAFLGDAGGGFYWSSVGTTDNNESCGLYVDSSYRYMADYGRDDGFSVRPVQGFAE